MSMATAEPYMSVMCPFVCAECGVCANRLRQEHSEGAGDQERGPPPLHHRAES